MPTSEPQFQDAVPWCRFEPKFSVLGSSWNSVDSQPSDWEHLFSHVFDNFLASLVYVCLFFKKFLSVNILASWIDHIFLKISLFYFYLFIILSERFSQFYYSAVFV